MNAATTLRIGDVVFFDYGCMCGEDFGTVLGFERTSFGTLAWVRVSDFSLTSVETLNGVVTGVIHKDYEGNEYLAARGVKGIGAYLVSKLRTNLD